MYRRRRRLLGVNIQLLLILILLLLLLPFICYQMCAWVTVIVVVAGVAVLIFLYKCVVGTSEVGWMRMDGWMDGTKGRVYGTA